MKQRRSDLNQKDWELCCRYIEELNGRGLSAHEPWEMELQGWAANPDCYPRGSTIIKLRLRFPADL
jgi:hypothetical protein